MKEISCRKNVKVANPVRAEKAAGSFFMQGVSRYPLPSSFHLFLSLLRLYSVNKYCKGFFKKNLFHLLPICFSPFDSVKSKSTPTPLPTIFHRAQSFEPKGKIWIRLNTRNVKDVIGLSGWGRWRRRRRRCGGRSRSGSGGGAYEGALVCSREEGEGERIE